MSDRMDCWFCMLTASTVSCRSLGFFFPRSIFVNWNVQLLCYIFGSIFSRLESVFLLTINNRMVFVPPSRFPPFCEFKQFLASWVEWWWFRRHDSLIGCRPAGGRSSLVKKQSRCRCTTFFEWLLQIALCYHPHKLNSWLALNQRTRASLEHRGFNINIRHS